MVPSPRQAGHVCCTVRNPARCRTWPCPPQYEHVSGLVPLAAPLPWHVSHFSCRRNLTVLATPLAASRSSSVTSQSTSAPRRTRRPPPPPNRSPKLLLPPKRSPKAAKMSSTFGYDGPPPPVNA